MYPVHVLTDDASMQVMQSVIPDSRASKTPRARHTRAGRRARARASEPECRQRAALGTEGSGGHWVAVVRYGVVAGGATRSLWVRVQSWRHVEFASAAGRSRSKSESFAHARTD